ncbi:MAG: hypothetical protein B7W98_00265, partial [Parcubacteria group bacterium 20-58-5]
ACAGALRHSDTVSDEAGAFLEADRQAQEVSAWPAVAFERHQPLDGQKAMEIAKVYRRPPVPLQVQGSAQTSAPISSTQGTSN